jgi:hypothetical protein
MSTPTVTEANPVTVSPDDQLKVREAIGELDTAEHRARRALDTLSAIASEREAGQPTSPADSVHSAAIRDAAQDVREALDTMRSAQQRHTSTLERLDFVHDASQLPF